MARDRAARPSTKPANPAAEPADGRAARSHRTRLAIIDAMRALHAEGELRPTARAIAQRAEVSLRTVWQHFADLETLLAHAGERDHQVLLSLTRPISPEQPLEARIEAFARHRARLLEKMTPSWRAARLEEPFSKELQRIKARTFALARDQVATVFGPELDRLDEPERTRLLDCLVAAGSWEHWDALRTGLKLSRPAAREVLVTSVTALLARTGADVG
ncbi:TetR/AcrR family transcriptional regulator [Streptomyces sp. A7024]|uniref:TetR/AcrR family transcriptional regulator n=1 Tax=Streptomyces coryli TaxID=1128680 RepID=A0A6G4TUJ7_9ACTN|nr:TetR/AcrR family transcriptional regulator [Streptomyces coryli]NGN62661.1 TetR/AcrR family transcriptional regulator [Streptomyces coryli]